MIENFKTFWLKYNESSSEKHQLFLKEHSVRNQNRKYPRGRTLFILNIPSYADEISLKNVFSKKCGVVELVELKASFAANNSGFNIGYIVFSSELSLDVIFLFPKDFTFVLNEFPPTCVVGIKKWCKEYSHNIEFEETIRNNIENYMKTYDKKVEERSVIDNDRNEDGWITVNSKKKRGKFAPSRKESTIEKIEKTEIEKNKKKQLLNFYTFQIRETKKQHLAELRKKFELDKKKLQQLKSKRSFKPFC